jgi:methanogenic corrinoid protein MtbC1
VFEEHLYTECMSGLLRHAIGALSETGTAQQPAILLTTFPQESHGLGLLMAECMMVLQGARCLSLGTQMPLRDIVKAVAAHQTDVVALSFSVSMNPNHVLDGLEELRRELPPHVEVWAGGRSPILQRRAQKGVVALRDLAQIAPEIKRWRKANAEA